MSAKRLKHLFFTAVSLVIGIGFFLSPLSFIKSSAASFTETKIRSIIADAQAKIDGLYDVDKTALEEKITLAQGYLQSSSLQSASSVAEEILALSSERKPVSAHAVWHRPTEKSLAELENSLDIYKDIGVNLVFVETFYHGYSMFKSDTVPYYKGFETANYGKYDDYLSAFSALAAERGIETHAWVENFYVGVEPNSPFLKEHPAWIMYNGEVQTLAGEKSLTYLQRSEGGAYIFIDPANDNVCNFLIEYYKELLEKNPQVTGLNLDYIRYPVSTQSVDTGYSRLAMCEFVSELGLENSFNPLAPLADMYEQFQSDVLSVSGNYQKWCAFRRRQITEFVERIYKEVKGEYGSVLSTAVFSSVSDSYDKKKQDWQTWFKNGWIDIATPMAYLDTATQVKNAVQTMRNLAGDKCYYYTGLASSYRNFPAYENVNQIQASYDGGAHGYTIFCATQVLGMTDVQKMLKLSSGGQTSCLPHASADKTLTAYKETLNRRVRDLYIPSGEMTQPQATALSQKMTELTNLPCSTSAEIAAIKNKVSALSAGDYASGRAQARISELFTELRNLLAVKESIALSNESLPKPKPPEESSSQSSETNSSGGSSQGGSSPNSGSSSGLTGCFGSVQTSGGMIACAILSAWLMKKRTKDR
ncbi:MAG: family 10 glycosylhydrolase [Clostridia bacterium]|nr:family 10 glycosylhydrolase [Clostridia bacterium]